MARTRSSSRASKYAGLPVALLVNYDAEARASPTHPKPNPTLPVVLSIRFLLHGPTRDAH